MADVVRRHWGFEVGRLEYLPEGGGAYHWMAQSGDGWRWFITCDDLDTKPWLGSDRDQVFAGLLTAYGAAISLRERAGLGFVVAPVPANSAQPAVRLDHGHSVAVFPYVAGEAGRWGQLVSPGDRHQLIRMLAELHRSTPATGSATQRGVEVPGRQALEGALQALDRPWDGGPLSELARHQLATHAEVIAGWLGSLDQLASHLDASPVDPVITHGEPHPGNLIRLDHGFGLVDWDTVALARPERDLWMLDDTAGAARTTYQDLTGRGLDPTALTACRLLWALADVAAFTSQLRGAHERNADSEKAMAGLLGILAGKEPAPYKFSNG